MNIELNNIYNIDCEIGIPLLQNNSIDLLLTSPPYNINLNAVKVGYDIYNDNKDHKVYIEWLKKLFELLYPKIKKGGRLCINIGDGKNGAIPTSSDIIQFMKDLNYLPLTHIIWNKAHTNSRTCWGSWMSPSCPSFPTPFEHILVFAKESLKLDCRGETDLTKEEFTKWAYSLWEFSPEKNQKQFNHSAMFPEELPKRCIKMFTYIDATVLDIFSGTGTTCKVAKDLNRNYIGFELSKNYYETSIARINKKKLF